MPSDNREAKQGNKIMYTVAGYTISTREQALTIYMMAKLQGRDQVAQQAKALINKLP